MGVQRMRDRVQRMQVECATNATTPGCNECEIGVQQMRERVQQMQRQVQQMQVRDERDYGSNGCSIRGARIVPRGAVCG
jgi:hypothetical protein